MADRRSMLDRLLTALEHPRVDGVLASAEIIDDLALLGALHDKVAVGTMNRGGLAGATLDDGRPLHRVRHGASARGQPRRRQAAAAHRLQRCRHRADAGRPRHRRCRQLNDAQMMAMVEPIPYTKNDKGEAVWDTDPLALVKAVGVSAALGGSSAYTWLKIQATADIATVAKVTTQPLLLLGGAPGPDPEATFALWEDALHQPTVRGLVIGRSLLYPRDGRRRRRGRARRRPGATGCKGPTMSTSLHRPAGTLADGDLAVSLTPDDAGWTYSGLKVVLLAPGVERSIDLGDSEGVVLPLSATDVDVTVDGEQFQPRRTDLGVRPRHRFRLRAARCDRRRCTGTAVARSRSPRSKCDAASRRLRTAPPTTSPSSCAAPARRRARSTTS